MKAIEEKKAKCHKLWIKGYSMIEIGKKLGITRQRVFQILKAK